MVSTLERRPFLRRTQLVCYHHYTFKFQETLTMTDIQKDDVDKESSNQGAGKIYEEEQYVVNDEGQVVVATADGEDGEDKKDPKAKLPEIHISEIATVTCQQDLDKILADHLEWTYAVLNPKADTAKGRANLKGADLRDYDLSGKNLSAANLSGANLQGIDMINSNLTATNLEGADMRCVNLRGAKLVRTKLTGADLRGADLTETILIGVDLTTAITKSPEAELAATAVSEQEAPATEDTPLFNNASCDPTPQRAGAGVATFDDSDDDLNGLNENPADTPEMESDIIEDDPNFTAQEKIIDNQPDERET